jgi:hypothetical protein
MYYSNEKAQYFEGRNSLCFIYSYVHQRPLFTLIMDFSELLGMSKRIAGQWERKSNKILKNFCSEHNISKMKRVTL